MFLALQTPQKPRKSLLIFKNDQNLTEKSTNETNDCGNENQTWILHGSESEWSFSLEISENNEDWAMVWGEDPEKIDHTVSDVFQKIFLSENVWLVKS